MATVDRWRRELLIGGILASVLYVAMTLFVGPLWEGYSVTSNVPSELAAIGAPTRTLWILRGAVYGVLMISIVSFMAWIVVLAIALLRRPCGAARPVRASGRTKAATADWRPGDAA